MWSLLRPLRPAAGVAPMAAFIMISAVPGLGQNAAPAATAPDQPACSTIVDKEIPIGNTIQAKASGGLNAAHMKAGKKIWITVGRGVAFPSCTMEADAAIYGEVIESSAVKSPPSSELALKFDHVDCEGKGKKEMKFWLVGVVSQSDASKHVRDDAPAEVKGGARQISDAQADTEYDLQLNPGGSPHTVKPGTVVGIKGLTLEPQGGPSCSAKLSSTDKNIELGPSTILVLAVGAGQ